MAGRVVTRAQDPKAGMTLAELYQVVQAADAANVDPRQSVEVRVGFRAQIISVSFKAPVVEAVVEPEPAPA